MYGGCMADSPTPIVEFAQEENNQNSSSDSVLVINTQPEDYEFLERSGSPDNNISVIPETQQSSTPLHIASPLELNDSPIPSSQVLRSVVQEVPRKTFPSKNNLTGRLLQIIVPFTDFPECPEPDCEFQFFAQTFSKTVHYLQQHLMNYHHKTIIATEYWYGLCNKFSFNNPKSHSCYRNVQLFNVDFSKYTFNHHCRRCPFGTNSKTQMKNHKCKYTPIHRDFPSSDPTLTPPHQVFAEQSPSPASQSSNIVPLTQHAETQPSPPSSNLPSQVSLIKEAVSLPSSSRPSGQSAPGLIGTCCRLEETNTLHFIFPITDFLTCTEDGCGARVSQKSWSPALHGLKTHFRNVDKILSPEIARWCGHCNVIMPPKISSQKCFSRGVYFRI